MRTVGIIAEYNPLHNGHIYHIQQAKARTGADFCIVVMSGSFVQRGEPACTDKFTRAKWAVQAGADLVLELPTVYALSSAMEFAIGGFRTLLGTGVLTDLSFGCEASDIDILYELNKVLTEEPPVFKAALRSNLKMGKSYPKARYDALADIGVNDRALQAVSHPNNMLAIEYLRAISYLSPKINPVPVSRVGGGYNSVEIDETFSSATAIRNAIKNGDRSVLDQMPAFVGGAILYDQQFPVDQELFGPLALYALRRMSPEEIAEIPDVAEGFEHVIARAVRTAASLEELYEAIKIKRFTLARCKRICMCALLGIRKGLVKCTASGSSEYLKVLALSKNGKALLSEISFSGRAPLIMRNSDILSCSELVKQNLEIDAFASDVYSYGAGRSIHKDSEGPLII